MFCGPLLFNSVVFNYSAISLHHNIIFRHKHSPEFVTDMFTVTGGVAPAPVGWQMMVRVREMPFR